MVVGLTGCAASAETTPTGTPTATATTSTTATATTTATTTATAPPPTKRPSIAVQVNPDRVTAGETSKVWILANCPLPSGGPAHTGTATSRAFLNGVPLNPVPAGSATPATTGSPANGSPWVRGEATVSGTVKRGSYTVDVKCDGTNDVGKATLKVVRAEADPTGVPTKAPRAGGGGTFGRDVDDESSIPLGPAGALVALVLVGGAVVMVKRRSRA
ncbi:hypothetical protein [Nonomuraea sp. NPDC001023]|uniref:hypothetical protein n=1 Tax=unclassified Nonomuraea TaxID=2593643 RepID=UPI003321CC8A